MENTIRETITAAAERAVDYWGTASDEEDLILAELAAAGLPVDVEDFRVMVESLIAIADADSNRDLSEYGWSANPGFDELSAFEAERREEYDAALNRVLDALPTADVIQFPARTLQAA